MLGKGMYHSSSTCSICGVKLLVWGAPHPDDTCAVCQFIQEDTSWDDIHPKVKKCECGAKKTNIPYHSDWCPLYYPPMLGKPALPFEEEEII